MRCVWLALLLCTTARGDAVVQANRILAGIRATGKPASYRTLLGQTARIEELRAAPALGKGAVVGKLHKVGRKILVVRLVRTRTSLVLHDVVAVTFAEYYRLKLLTRPRYDGPPPGVEKPKSGVEKPKPGVGKPKPGVGKPKPGVGKPKPGVGKPKPGVEKSGGKPPEKPGKRTAWGDPKALPQLDRRDPVNLGYHMLRYIVRNDIARLQTVWSDAAMKRFDRSPVTRRTMLVNYLRQLKRRIGTARSVREIRDALPGRGGGVYALVRMVGGKAVVLHLTRQGGRYVFDQLYSLPSKRYREGVLLWPARR